MISTNYSTNHSPAFKQINVVRVSKKAFQNPEDVLACTMDFSKALDKTSGNKEGLMDLLFALLGRCDKVKTAHNLEGGMGIKFTDVPLEQDVHTFSVFTGEDKDAVSNLCSLSNIIETTKQIVKDESNKHPMEVIGEKIKDLCSKKQIVEFRLDNLDKLVELKSKLGL